MSGDRETPLTARCYCGAVKLQLRRRPRSAIHCHCTQCRRLSGAAFTTWVSARLDAVVDLDRVEASHLVQRFEATPNVTRVRCTVCGTHVYTLDRRMPQVVGIPAGVLPDGEVPAVKGHWYSDDAAPWCRLDETLPTIAPS
jgi:hypothetical protein